MSTLTPKSTVDPSVLPSKGDPANVAISLPHGIYARDDYWTEQEVSSFISGAVEQVAFVYQRLSGPKLNIEIAESQVYAAYEEACLEYSSIYSVHQSQNVLSNILGAATASFDHRGQIISTDGVTKDTNLIIKYPKFDFTYARRVTEAISSEAGIGGSTELYSGSFPVVPGKQDYDLQEIFAGTGAPFETLAANKQLIIRKVYYKTPAAMWNFYGYYGSINVVGNLANYGQYADASTFELVPVWQHKAQARNFEDHLKTRTSDYGFRIVNNKLRLFPAPSDLSPPHMWVEFMIPQDTWVEGNSDIGINGVSSMNNAPFEHIPYATINAGGKHWIRRYSLALCMVMLGMTRSKFSTIPVPGSNIQLDGRELITMGNQELENLRRELREDLAGLTYEKLMEGDAKVLEQSTKIMEQIPTMIYTK